MFIILRIPWILFTVDGTSPRPCYVPSGTYELERIANPFGENGRSWLVIRGTRVGASEEFFTSMNNPGYGEFALANAMANDDRAGPLF